MSRMYSPQASQDGHSAKNSLASPAAEALLGEFDRLRDRRVPSGKLDSGDRSDISSERQMSVMEKDLRDDAPWKRIQRNTFTRWTNEHLKNASEAMTITDLQHELADGIKLIALIEVLSGKKLPKFNKRPTFRSQKLENVSLALQFLEEEEDVKLVSIDSTDIVDGRLKLILGLIWALILHYSISLPQWGDDENVEKKMTPKERLLSWFSNKLPIPVKNFTTDWNDGRACGALDNAVAPGLCPDWESWDPKDALRNATEAMTLAEKWLDVKQLIRPEDMIDPNMDEQSMMTYLAQFPVAKAKPGTPNLAKSVGDAKLVRCTGRGLQSTGIRIEKVFFRVCTKAAGEGILTVTMNGPDGHPYPFHSRQISQTLYEYSYSPVRPGRYTVDILFGGRHVIGSPFLVNVGLPSKSKIRAFGPGLTGGAVGYSADFNVDMMGEPGMLGFSIAGPSEVKIDCKDRGDYVASVKYWPTSVGEYAVHILCGEEDVPGSPFMAEVIALPQTVDPSKVRFEFITSKQRGRGAGGALPEVAFSVDTRLAGSGLAALEVSVLDGAYRNVVVSDVETSSGVHTFSFTPEDSSPHYVQIVYGGVSVPGSPIKVPLEEPIVEKIFDKVDSAAPVKCDVSSVTTDGLDAKVYTNRMLEFTVDARSVSGKLDGELRVILTSPSGISTEALVSRKAAGLYVVSYSVFEEGIHTVDICYDDTRIPGSPYTQLAMRSSPPPPSSPAVKGSQVIESSTEVSEVTEDGATIVTRRETRVTSQVVTSSHLVYTEELDESGGVLTSETVSGTQSLRNSAQDVRSLAGSRCDVAKVVATGIGLEKALCNKPNSFTVKADAAGYNMLLVGIYGKILHAHEVEVKHIGHAHYQVVYLLKERGEYLLSVKYGDVHIPGSPFVINCV